MAPAHPPPEETDPVFTSPPCLAAVPEDLAALVCAKDAEQGTFSLAGAAVENL